MTTIVTLKKEVEKIREKTMFKPRKVITVTMWRPGGEDLPDDGGVFRVKAMKNVPLWRVNDHVWKERKPIRQKPEQTVTTVNEESDSDDQKPEGANRKQRLFH